MLEVWEDKINSIVTTMTKEAEEYNNSNWPYKQAAYLAEIRVLRENITFFKEK